VAVTSKKMPVRRWMQGLNKAMPVLLDTTGIILLSASAMLWDPIAGTAAAGLGCFVLNKRHYDDGGSGQ
jgi:hypothetical protein